MRPQNPLPGFYTLILRPRWAWEPVLVTGPCSYSTAGEHPGLSSRVLSPRPAISPSLGCHSFPTPSCEVPYIRPGHALGSANSSITLSSPESRPPPFSLSQSRQQGACPARELGSSVNHAFRALCDAEMKDG